MYCNYCNLDLINNDNLFGDLMYDCTFLCINCLNMNIKKEEWYCYILQSLNNKYKNHTYNGKTNNPYRRIKQHNGILVGGAKKTRITRPNEIYCIIKGFDSNVEALQAEWRIKHPDKKKKRPKIYNGINGRIISLNTIFQDTQFTSNSQRMIKDMDLTIWIIKDKAFLLKNIPPHFTLIIVDKIDITQL